MAHHLSVATQEPVHILIRLFNNGINTLDLIRDRIFHIFSSLFPCKSHINGPHRSLGHDKQLASLEDFFVNVGYKYHIETRDWLPQKNCDENGGSQEAFNVLDTMLKGSLERLKIMRESVSLSNICFKGCSLTSDYSGNLAMIRSLCSEGKSRAALWLRKNMIHEGVIPDVLAHNYILNGLCRSGDLENADWLIREMLEIGPTPNCSTYNTFIKE